MHVVLLDFNFFEYTASLANALAKIADVSLLVPYGFRAVEAALSPAVRLHYFAKPRLRSPANLRMTAHLWRTLDRLRPDVVHLLAVNPWFNLSLLARRPPCLVTTIHDPVMHLGDRSQRNIPQWVRDIPVRRSHRLILHGEALKRLLLARHPLPSRRVATLPIGEMSIYRHWDPRPWPERRGRVLFFGRIWPYKGLDYLIRAEPAVSAACPDAHFVIAGRGESLARYRRMMVHPERFEVRDEYIPRADVPRLFQEAALVALPYVEASQSAVVPLAYAFGKPVVASAVGGLPEMVEDGQDGLLVPPRDSDRLAAAIVALLRDDERRRRMQAHIRRKVAGELSWDSIARSTLRVYEESRGEGEG